MSNSTETIPLSWREILAEVFMEAERRGLGTFAPGFQATSGMEDAAADFIGARCEHLGDIRLGETS